MLLMSAGAALPLQGPCVLQPRPCTIYITHKGYLTLKYFSLAAAGTREGRRLSGNMWRDTLSYQCARLLQPALRRRQEGDDGAAPR